MPGNDLVNRQSVLGSAAGIALLVFALGYRFLPPLGGGAAIAPKPAPAPVGAPMSVQAPPPLIARPSEAPPPLIARQTETPSSIAPPESTQPAKSTESV